jgi:Family of unknown function (DUF5990)
MPDKRLKLSPSFVMQEIKDETRRSQAAGPYVRGGRADRHLFLAWGDVHSDGTLRLIRGSKLGLVNLDPRLVKEAMRPGHRLIARIRLTGTRAEPALTWSAGPADAEPG